MELTVLRLDEVRPWRWPPRRELQYGEWLRTQLATGDASPLRPREDPDVAVLITQARDAETHDPWNDHRDDVRRLADLLGVGQ